MRSHELARGHSRSYGIATGIWRMLERRGTRKLSHRGQGANVRNELMVWCGGMRACMCECAPACSMAMVATVAKEADTMLVIVAAAVGLSTVVRAVLVVVVMMMAIAFMLVAVMDGGAAAAMAGLRQVVLWRRLRFSVILAILQALRARRIQAQQYVNMTD
eukprot:2446452-Pleurochrysis_carterae.AAC.4